MLAEREQSGEQMRGAIDRASELVKDGLADARQAVGALRGEELPGVGRLPSLIEDFRRDMDMAGIVSQSARQARRAEMPDTPLTVLSVGRVSERKPRQAG